MRSTIVTAALTAAMAAGATPARAAGPGPSAATAGVLTLPDGPGSVAGLGTEAEANVFSGQVSYGVPFGLPPGPAGFGPELGLSYSGELGNGVVGVGWTLSTPLVRRTTREGVPGYDGDDEVELLGPVSGRLLGEGARYWVEGAGRSVRVERIGERWTVTDSSGIRYVFGLSEASRVVAADGRVAAWLLEAVFHPTGQRIDYTYRRGRGELYLESITWGPSAMYRVELDYGVRFDPVTSYRYGFEVVTAERLHAVTVVADGRQLRRYQLTYDEEHSLSRLETVGMTGADVDGDGEGEGALPAASFTYAEPMPVEVRPLHGAGGWTLDQRGVTFVDVDGDGMADLGRFEMGNYEFRRNRGDRFGARSRLAGLTSYDLQQVRLVDVDGDARPELVRVVADTWRTSRLGEDGWTQHGTWPGSDGVPLRGSGVVVTDLDGDGRADVLRAAASGSQVWFNSARGFRPSRFLPPVSAADVQVELGADNVRVVDVNGDSLADVVWLTDAWMKVFLGRGDGSFVPWRRVFYPWGITAEAPGTLRLGDLNRDGLVDLVRVTASHIRYYRGRADGGFHRHPRHVSRPDGSDADAVVALADANGNGSLDIVWSSPRGTWLVDLAAATTAGMLVAIDNGMGKTTRFGYRASARMAAADRLAGRPWRHALPTSIPVPVSVSVDVGDGSPVRTKRYAVRDGVWDGVERRFAGFLEGRTVYGDGSADDDAETVAFFHPGLGDQRALRGRTARTEIWRSDGSLHQVTRYRWAAHAIDGMPRDEPRLRVPVVRETRTEHHEGVAEAVETLAWSVHDGEGRAVEQWNLGRLDVEGDEVVMTRRYTARDPDTWVGDLVCVESMSSANGEQVSSRRILYGNRTHDAPLCEPGLGVGRRTQEWLDTAGAWKDRDRIVRLSRNWNVLFRITQGTYRSYVYDAHDFRTVTERVNTRSDSGVLEWTGTWDVGRGLLTTLTDAAGAVTTMEYDALGRLTSLAAGDAPPYVHYRYDWSGDRPTTETFTFDGEVSALAALPEDWSPTASWRHTISVVNGAGEVLRSAVRVDASAWLVSGAVDRDHKGRVVSRADPYAWSGSDPRWAAAPDSTPRQSLRYDGLDRVVEQTLADGTRQTTSHSAFVSRTETEGLTAVTSEVDGLGRVIRTERTLDDGEVQLVDADYDPAGRLTAMHLQGGAVSHRFEYDTLGRLIYAVDPDIGERSYTYWDSTSIASLLLRTATNAEGQAVRYDYDHIGRLTSVTGHDGARYVYHYDAPRAGSDFAYTRSRLAWVEEPTGIVEAGYDAYGQQARVRRSIADLDRDRDLVAEETTTFSPSGLIRQIDFHDGLVVDYGYDLAGRLTSIGDYWTLGEQDASGRVLSETYGNGLVQVYQRDALGQPTRVTVGAEGVAPIYDVEIGRTAWGGVDSVIDHDGVGLDHSASFTYDGAARLTRAVLGSAPEQFGFDYQYDALQNLVLRAYAGPKQLDLYLGDYRYGEAGAGPRQLTSVTAPDDAVSTFAYDAAGRQVRHGNRTMHYNGFDQLVRVDLLEDPDNPRSVRHAYGYDGFRIYSRSTGGDVQYWFSPGTSERNGVREHLLHAGDRLIARVTVGRIEDVGTAGPATMGALSAGSVAGGLILALLGWALARALRRSPMRRRRLAPAAAMVAALAAFWSSTGCAMLFGKDERPSWRMLETRYYHATVSAGPSIITGDDGLVYEERRYEPFGTAIDAYRDVDADTWEIGDVDYRRDPHNILNKKTDPDTSWSYHGARWVAPQTTMWLTPDPPVMAPDPDFMAAPWALHPYQYVEQNPILFWDPDGKNPDEHVEINGKLFQHMHGQDGGFYQVIDLETGETRVLSEDRYLAAKQKWKERWVDIESDPARRRRVAYATSLIDYVEAGAEFYIRAWGAVVKPVGLAVDIADASEQGPAETPDEMLDVLADGPSRRLGGSARGTSTGGAGLGLKAPAGRHQASRVKQNTVAKKTNTVAEPGVDMAADAAAINAGNATRSGADYVVNGRTYGVHDGTLYPVSGPGLHQLNRAAFKALGVFNKFGNTQQAARILNKMRGPGGKMIHMRDRIAALRVWQRLQ